MKRTIAIIGAGQMGRALAIALCRGENRVLVYDRRPARAQALVQSLLTACGSTDAEAMDCGMTASWEADIIIPAVPYAAQREVADLIRHVATQKIVISLANPENPSPGGVSAAEELQQLLPHSRIVKAFSTVAPERILQPSEGMECAIAGDHAGAVEEVSCLVRSAGMVAIPAGKLSQSKALEAGSQ